MLSTNSNSQTFKTNFLFWSFLVSLTPLYKFRTSKLFANPSTSTSNPVETGSTSLSDAKDINAQYSSILLATESDPLAIHFMHFCSDSRKLLTASSYHTCLLHFSRREINLETAVSYFNHSVLFLAKNRFLVIEIYHCNKKSDHSVVDIIKPGTNSYHCRLPHIILTLQYGCNGRIPICLFILSTFVLTYPTVVNINVV